MEVVGTMKSSTSLKRETPVMELTVAFVRRLVIHQQRRWR